MSYSAKCQQVVTGKVLSSADRIPLPGATVSSQRSGLSAKTGGEGSFEIRCFPGNDTLVVSHVGFTKTTFVIPSEVSGPLTILMDRTSSALEEVVINTGYYRVPKERATGSFVHIDSALYNRAIGVNVLDRLEGVANGLQFNRNRNYGELSRSPALRLRGVSTIESDAAPLIVVDDFPYEGDINSINPNDVESITLLRDAAAASIWGARAGNGVIVITTKRGQYDQRHTVSVTANSTISEKPNLFYGKDRLPAPVVMQIEEEMFKRGMYAEQDQTALPYYVELMIGLREGTVSPAEYEREKGRLQTIDIREEATRHLYRPSLHQQYAMNFRGGGDRHRYYLSGGYDNWLGSVIGNESRRLNLNMNNTVRLMRGLELDLGLWYATTRDQQNGLSLANLHSSGIGAPSTYTALRNSEGNAMPIVRNYRYAYAARATENGLVDWMFRPLDEVALADQRSTASNLRFDGALRYRFLRHFSANFNYRIMRQENQGRNYFAPESYYVRDLVNRFTQEDGTLVIPHNGILHLPSEHVLSSQSGRLQVNYDQSFDNHRVVALAGGEVREQVLRTLPESRVYNYDDDLLTGATIFDYTRFYPVRPTGVARILSAGGNSSQSLDRFVSYFSNVSYTYKSRYTLTNSLRWDASNLFGVKTNQKGVPLWSAGIGWELSKEPFYKTGLIPYARVRLTYGSSGNVNTSVSVFPTARYGINTVTSLTEAFIRSIGNPSLRWEKVKTVNAGIDFATKGNRFSGTLEVYEKRASDLLGYDYLDPTTGLSGNLQQMTNYADMRTRGLDVQLTSRNIDRRFKWYTTVLFSTVKNEILNYRTSDVSTIIPYLSNSAAPPVVGRSRDVVYALPWHGLDPQTGAVIAYVDGQPSTDYGNYINGYLPEELLVAGVDVPTYHGSMRNLFAFGNLELSALISWKGGHVFRRESMVPGGEYQGYDLHHTDYLDRWKQPGDEMKTHVPAATDSYSVQADIAYSRSQVLITKGDHIRLDEMGMTYALRGQAVNFLPATSSIRLTFYARNLGILWRANKLGIDPEYPLSSYPALRSYALGIQVDF